MDKKEMICIACPIGCHLTVAAADDMPGGYRVTGNQCPRGEKYGIKEMTNPTRMVTSTVVVKGGALNRLPVKTSEPIPKERIFQCMDVINSVQVEAPVQVGQVIVKDLLGLNVDIVATRSM